MLLLNDCVIIPDLGGFVANYKPAEIRHDCFLPPSKEIAFNPKLRKSDGLLINYISEKEGLGFFDAKLKVESFVDGAFLILQRYEKLKFAGIGDLYYDRMENLQFEPAIDQNLLIDAYGLDEFTFEKLYQRLVPDTATKVQHSDNQPIVFSRRNVKKVLIGAPLLLALALIPMKKTNDIVDHSNLNIITQLTEVVAPMQEKVTEPETAQFVEEKVAPVEENRYFVIGGSFKELANAQEYMQQMKDEGYSPENLGVFNGLYRISIQGFASMNDAKTTLNSLRQENPKSGYWIHVKN